MAIKDLAIPGFRTSGALGFIITRGLSAGASPSVFFLAFARPKVLRAAKKIKLFLVRARPDFLIRTPEERLFTIDAEARGRVFRAPSRKRLK